MKHFSGKKRWLLAPLFLAGIAALVWVTMLLWNALLPDIFHLPQINYWQTAGLLILSRLLFGFGGHGRGFHAHRRGHLQGKWENMSPEEREKFKDHLREHRRFWDDARDCSTAKGTAEHGI